MAAESDAPSVGKHSDEHLRRFLAARDAGDAEAMRRWWGELVIDFFPRIQGFVQVVHGGRLDEEEEADAVQVAMLRFSHRVIHTFNGTSMGELVNFCKKLAQGCCIDVQRASRRARGDSVPLDGHWDADAEDQVPASWETDEAVRRFERDERSGDAQAFLDWAVPQLGGARRAVMELTLHGSELSEICDELSLSRDNAYQLRSRAVRDLKKLERQYES